MWIAFGGSAALGFWRRRLRLGLAAMLAGLLLFVALLLFWLVVLLRRCENTSSSRIESGRPKRDEAGMLSRCIGAGRGRTWSGAFPEFHETRTKMHVAAKVGLGALAGGVALGAVSALNKDQIHDGVRAGVIFASLVGSAVFAGVALSPVPHAKLPAAIPAAIGAVILGQTVGAAGSHAAVGALLGN